jgi:hypothetical protein
MKERITKLLTGKAFMIALSFAGLYLLSTGASWALFSYVGGEPSLNIDGNNISDARSKIDPGLPKTEECPLNGKMFTEPERAIWEERRPLMAVIENHLDARPQSGLSKADVIYEVVAEGGITRFLAGFYCGSASEDVRIGPIRSARVYLINWAAEYGENPLFVHVGGANNICGNCPGGVKYPGTVAKKVMALEELIDLGWRHSRGNALDAGANVGFPAVWRDYERIPGAATEHTYMGSTDKLTEIARERGFGYENGKGEPWTENFASWRFADDSPVSPSKSSEISFEFWRNKPDYDVSWKYQKESNSYLRFNGGKPHMDMDSDKQIEAKNVVIQFVEEEGPVDKELHMFYTTIGEGKALIFKNGNVVEGTWEKQSQKARTKFFDSKGGEVEFVRGVIFIEAVPEGNEINY